MESLFASEFVEIKLDKPNGVIIVEWKQVCLGMGLRDILAKVIEFSSYTPNAKVMFIYNNYFTDLVSDEKNNFFMKLKGAGVNKFAYSIANCDIGLANQLMSQYHEIQIFVNNNPNQAFSNLMSNNMNVQQPMGSYNQAGPMNGLPMGSYNQAGPMNGQPMGSYNQAGPMNGQPMAGIPYVDPKKYISPEDNAKANRLSGIALLCPILTFIITRLVNVYVNSSVIVNSMNYHDGQSILRIFESITGIIDIFGFALMIYVRAKYPNNTFGKVVMWIYIIFIILLILFIIAFLAACGLAIQSCSAMG